VKTEIQTEKVEVVKQVRLTTKQRLTLVNMQNHGGRHESHYFDYSARVDLIALGLIEEGPELTEQERKAVKAELAQLWKSLPAMVRSKSVEALDRAIDEIRSRNSRLESKTWWLTDAANEYLTKGRVVITR
jgi:hypothetical protein